MGITRTTEYVVADAWGNDQDEVTVKVGDTTATLTLEEAHEYGRQVMQAALDAAQAVRERNVRPEDQNAL